MRLLAFLARAAAGLEIQRQSPPPERPVMPPSTPSFRLPAMASAPGRPMPTSHMRRMSRPGLFDPENE